MSSHTAKINVSFFPSYKSEIDQEDSINFTKIIIPFSEFGTSQNLIYIYNGNENIKFNERHPVYRKLLLNEFE